MTPAIGQFRPPLADRGCALSNGVRLRTLADVFAYRRRRRRPCVWT
ncbi:hypothetical protein [Polymorphospora rubra]